MLKINVFRSNKEGRDNQEGASSLIPNEMLLSGSHLKTEAWQGSVSANILGDRDGDGGLVEHRQLVIDVSHLEDDIVKMIIKSVS